jgi:hypothetical protein
VKLRAKKNFEAANARVLWHDDKLYVCLCAAVAGAVHALLQSHFAECDTGIQSEVFGRERAILVVTEIRVCWFTLFPGSLKR